MAFLSFFSFSDKTVLCTCYYMSCRYAAANDELGDKDFLKLVDLAEETGGLYDPYTTPGGFPPGAFLPSGGFVEEVG